ncbi:MAG: hypothetical protein ACRD0K_30510 [Egibacteraceae bacterium]
MRITRHRYTDKDARLCFLAPIAPFESRAAARRFVEQHALEGWDCI